MAVKATIARFRATFGRFDMAMFSSRLWLCGLLAAMVPGCVSTTPTPEGTARSTAGLVPPHATMSYRDPGVRLELVSGFRMEGEAQMPPGEWRVLTLNRQGRYLPSIQEMIQWPGGATETSSLVLRADSDVLWLEAEPLRASLIEMGYDCVWLMAEVVSGTQTDRHEAFVPLNIATEPPPELATSTTPLVVSIGRLGPVFNGSPVSFAELSQKVLRIERLLPEAERRVVIRMTSDAHMSDVVQCAFLFGQGRFAITLWPL